ncbi:hypothetical protein Vi05172_g1312 [Venturia inaequalis]|nr:hypothetical protein Vi05172_g1312 [Venturia inaequalis]
MRDGPRLTSDDDELEAAKAERILLPVGACTKSSPQPFDVGPKLKQTGVHRCYIGSIPK